MYIEDKINDGNKKDNKQTRKEEKDGVGDKSKPQGRNVQWRILTGASVATPDPTRVSRVLSVITASPTPHHHSSDVGC
jgi:hypothetical protein